MYYICERGVNEVKTELNEVNMGIGNFTYTCCIRKNIKKSLYVCINQWK